MALADELATILAGIDALSAFATALQTAAIEAEKALPQSQRDTFDTLLKGAANEAASLAHGDATLAAKAKRGVVHALHGLGHLLGGIDRGIADTIDPTSTVTVTASSVPTATTEHIAVAAGKTS